VGADSAVLGFAGTAGGALLGRASWRGLGRTTAISATAYAAFRVIEATGAFDHEGLSVSSANSAINDRSAFGPGGSLRSRTDNDELSRLGFGEWANDSPEERQQHIRSYAAELRKCQTNIDENFAKRSGWDRYSNDALNFIGAFDPTGTIDTGSVGNRALGQAQADLDRRMEGLVQVQNNPKILDALKPDPRLVDVRTAGVGSTADLIQAELVKMGPNVAPQNDELVKVLRDLVDILNGKKPGGLEGGASRNLLAAPNG
jgi:hypothetical protein